MRLPHVGLRIGVKPLNALAQIMGLVRPAPTNKAKFFFDTPTFMPKDFKFSLADMWVTRGNCRSRNRTCFSPKPFYQILHRASAFKSGFDVLIWMDCPSLAAGAKKGVRSFPLQHCQSFVFKLIDDVDDEDPEPLWYFRRDVRLATGAE